MIYTENNVFPIKEAYKFADHVGGEMKVIANIIKGCDSLPIDEKYGGKSQARRALAYIALKKYGIWEEFVEKLWPGAGSRYGLEITRELENDYINNGRLLKYIDELPNQLRELVKSSETIFKPGTNDPFKKKDKNDRKSVGRKKINQNNAIETSVDVLRGEHGELKRFYNEKSYISGIPRNITREHILKAIEEVGAKGIPKGRQSRKFFLEHNGKYYPPKYIISTANRYANGVELDSGEFSGGKESNFFLKNLGFLIKISEPSKNHPLSIPEKVERVTSQKKTHDERCPQCKETIKRLLEKIYGKVIENHIFEVGTLPEDFKNTPYYERLKEIYQALQSYRGFKKLVRTKRLPPCDLFVKNPGFILEYDENQHFTIPRKISLERYPENLPLGFDKRRWIDLCEQTKAKDNDKGTPHRDEQRAWYETLRDFLPSVKGLKPTVRLRMKDFVWCNLNADNQSDIEYFKRILKGEPENWDIQIIEDPNPSIGRIIIAENWAGKPEEARNLLEEVYIRWPKDKKVKFLMTCGGFVQFQWPNSISRKEIGDNKNPKMDSVIVLIKEAEKTAQYLLREGLGEKLSEIADYITLGIDSYKEKISMTQSHISQLHIETVLLLDLKINKYDWTGKSYPTPGQQDGLVRITDLKTHFVNVNDIGKVMILGCHDMTMFNNRNMKKTGGWRKKIKKEFSFLSQVEKPRFVLHHPHTTVKTATWKNGWSMITKTLPSVIHYAGAGRFYEPDREKSEYDDLVNVLRATKRAATIDFVLRRTYLSEGLSTMHTLSQFPASSIPERWEIKNVFLQSINSQGVDYKIIGSSIGEFSEAVFYFPGLGGSLDDCPEINTFASTRRPIIRGSCYGLKPSTSLLTPIATFGDVCALLYNSRQALLGIANALKLKSYRITGHSWGGGYSPTICLG